jgi:hypothetical protein
MWGTRSVNKVSVFASEDISWTESAISWNNAPSDLSLNPDTEYNFAVSSAINGKRPISFMLETLELSKEPAVFNSKDLNIDSGPTLVIDYSLPVDFGLIGAVGLGVAVIGTVVVALVFRSKKRNTKTKPLVLSPRAIRKLYF